MKQIIDGHNKAILKTAAQPDQQTTKMCNCRKKDECPLKGECLKKEIVYQATVTTRENSETYVGLAATEFKTRWRNHQMSFKHEEKRNDTELTKYLWQLKEKKKDFSIEWKILAKAIAYTHLTKRCNLCITEKFFLLYPNRKWRPKTKEMNLYQLVGIEENTFLGIINYANNRTFSGQSRARIYA